jgi:HPt (histidine-containing phosphotransfer) domain-containing protein
MTHITIPPPGPLYSSYGADPDLGELVALFVNEIPQRVDQLLSDLESGNRSGVQRTAHQLKGAAGSYGFSQVTPYAACVESLIRREEGEDQVRAAIAELVEVCRRMRSGAPGLE